MFLTKIKIATAVLVGAVLVSAGAGGVSHRLFAAGWAGAGNQAESPAAQVDEQKAAAEKQERVKELELLNEQLQKEVRQLQEHLLKAEAVKAVAQMRTDQLTDQLAKERAVNAALRKELQGKGAVTAAPIALEQAREEVELREAQLEVQQAILEGVATQLPGAKRHLERVAPLAGRTFSQEELERARSQVENLEAQYKVKKAETKVAEVHLKHARQRLARLEEKKPLP